MTISVLKSSKHIEERGELFTSFDQKFFDPQFNLDRVSVSKRGVIRGFHGDDHTWKLVSCMCGSFKLVVYDIENDTTERIVLSSDDKDFTSVLIPPRHLNAHQCLTEKCVLHYKWDQPYDLSKQYSVYYNDNYICPLWEDIHPIVSDRDKNSKVFKDAFGHNS